MAFANVPGKHGSQRRPSTFHSVPGPQPTKVMFAPNEYHWTPPFGENNSG